MSRAEQKTITVFVDLDLYEEFRQFAAANERSMGAELRLAMRRLLNEARST